MTDIYNYICNNLEYFFDNLYLENFIYNLADKYYIEYMNNKNYDMSLIIEKYENKVYKLSKYEDLINENREKLLLILTNIKNHN
jgi:hypothetical protein